MASGDAVQVAVRVRPLSANEESQGSEACVDVVDASVLLAEKQFDFDAALPATTQQVHSSWVAVGVFSTLVAPMISQFFDGYNATVLAYGQTGSGKTYTMGNDFASSVAPTERGVIPRVIENVFDRVSASSNPHHFVLKLSYLEILNGEIHDLLTRPSLATPQPTSTGLSVRGDGDRGIVVAGLSEHVVDSTDQAADLLHSGALHRATASTSMNAQSSRSHAICTILMEHHGVSAAEGGTETRFSKFHLVDLAGSERVRRTNAEGARFKEGVNINRGLLVLGNVINALCERSRTNSLTAHIPYRDSKLTRLLQDSLGGNSKTLMIACISPADVNYEETSNTLRYASRTRNIENQAVINKERSAENEVIYLKQQLEIVQLQLLQQTQGIACGPVRIGDPHSGSGMSTLEEENCKLREELLLANSAKAKWEKIADELANKNKRVDRESKLGPSRPIHMSTPTKKAVAGIGSQSDKGDRGIKSSHQSRLEQLKKFQSHKGKSVNTKETPAVKRRTDGTVAPNKRSRTLMSPSTNTADIGSKSLSARRVSVLPSPGKKGVAGGSGVQSMEAIIKLLRQVMASHDAIFTAKEAVRSNVAGRKALALEIARLEALSSEENAENLARLQDDLHNKTACIRVLQRKLASVEKNVSLPSELFPVKVDTCHALIHHLILTLVESKEECMALLNCRLELDAANTKFVAAQDSHSKLQVKLREVMKELQVMQDQATKKKAAKKRKKRESYETMETLFSSSDEDEDNSGADSDYVDDEDRRQRRIKRKRGYSTPGSKVSKNVDVMDEIDKLLETSAASCCSCHGKCVTKACACKSQSRVCSDECSCNSEKCRNRTGGEAPGDTPSFNLHENDEPTDLIGNALTPSTPERRPIDVSASEAFVTAVPEVVAPVTIDLMSP
ncbi:hypothetical protein PHYPSEUDO_001545 [Phytophthora pseudosyringae]|uniref:Kinesin-like protein n=1 Tax=Phytophthora pseudosyringae TaxID=221518 RepID=A0A8T1VWW0_9STRA|nr:hypothetical protein PHYPSEUDO_001545 [Phytophthora pseudosyringae]